MVAYEVENIFYLSCILAEYPVYGTNSHRKCVCAFAAGAHAYIGTLLNELLCMTKLHGDIFCKMLLRIEAVDELHEVIYVYLMLFSCFSFFQLALFP